MSKTPYRKVFIYYPRGLQTGGPEALHQLAAELRLSGVASFLVPLKGTERQPKVDAYEHFGVPEAFEIEDAEDCAVVVPEAGLSGLRGIQRAVKFCWWLSIDNSDVFRSNRIIAQGPKPGVRNRLRRLKHRLLLPREAVLRRRLLRSEVIHLSQSRYASDFLFRRFGCTTSPLSDYTSLADILQAPRVTPPVASVAFNPAKGGDLILQLQNDIGDSLPCEWVPLRGLSRPELVAALRSATIYLDLGHQPGKDRIPREAAVAGAISLVARRGSGAFFEDVPLPDEHKIAMENPIRDAERAIRAVLKNPSAEAAKQDAYRNVIFSERQRFHDEVVNIFVKT